jgi:hypothetical protein
MIEAFSNIGTAFGLSTSAGLNAYLPLLVVAITARYTDWIKLNEPWDVLTSGWVIGVLAVLLLIEMTVDKIPIADHANDLIQTIGRPAAGAILFAAGSGVIGEMHPVPTFVAGLLLAGGVHAVKSTARPMVTATTGGMGNWAVSIVEDVLALIGSILAIFLPMVLACLLGVFCLLLAAWFLRRRSTSRAVPA